MKNMLFVFTISMLIISCGISKDEYQKILKENELLKNDIERLNMALEQYENGAERTVALLKKDIDQNNISSARKYLNILMEYHPEELQKKEMLNIIYILEQKEKDEILRLELEEKERIRLANINNTGIWRNGFYVDSFGRSTNEGYITNTEFIVGTFSNTATQDSPLNVRILISNSNHISIQLYEYASNNPVKSSSTTGYTVELQDNDGNRKIIRADNSSDRLEFDEYHSQTLHNVLMKGGLIKFRISRNTNIYQFDIKNADWYENAYRKLIGN